MSRASRSASAERTDDALNRASARNAADVGHLTHLAAGDDWQETPGDIRLGVQKVAEDERAVLDQIRHGLLDEGLVIEAAHCCHSESK